MNKIILKMNEKKSILFAKMLLFLFIIIMLQTYTLMPLVHNIFFSFVITLTFK